MKNAKDENKSLLISLFGSLIAVGISVGIFLIYLRKKAQQLDSDEQEQPLNVIVSDILEKNTELFRNELASEETQQLIMNCVAESITALLAEKENQQAINDYVGGLFTNLVNELMPQITGMPPISEQDLKQMDEKTDSALGALTVNAALESLPTGASWALDKIYPNWKEEAQKDPRAFGMLFSKAKEYGLLDMITNMGGQPKTVQSTSQSSGF